MKRTVLTLFGAVLSIFVLSPAPAPAAASHDGAWTVLVVTEQGACDRAYRYNLKVARGRIDYDGPEPVNVTGSVAANGAVKVSIRLGDKSANGTGKLTAQAGAGRWQGSGGSQNCSGTWEAERR